jgi:hypothetical protein
MHFPPTELDRLWRAKVDAARAMTPAERLLAGPRLFDLACEFTIAGIRAQQPGISEDGALTALRARVAGGRRRELAP